MGSDNSEVQKTPSCIKVHLDMCTLLLRLVDRISSIFPDIEAARPRCSSGIEALCMLQRAMEKARILVQNCCKSSKLYLALTGNAVVERFEGTRNCLQQSLSQLQNMVPVVLQFEISKVLGDLRDTVFFMDSHEEEAGKALQVLLLQHDRTSSVGNYEIDVLQYAASRLHLSSQKDLLIERRSIQKLLHEVKEGTAKREALRSLLYLLKKYDKLILQGQTRNPLTKPNETCLFVKPDIRSVTTNSINLEHCSTRITVSDAILQTSAFSSLETSSDSVCSTASSMKDLHLQIDMSNLSLGSLDSSYSSDISHVNSQRFQFFRGTLDIRRQFLSNVSGLPWESQCRAVQDVQDYLIYNPSCASVSLENILEPLVQFLKDALDKHDARAQKAGSQLFLTFLRVSRRDAVPICEDVYTVLASYLGTEAAAETLDIMKTLSAQESAPCKLALDWIPLLVPFLGDSFFAGTCLRILDNLCRFQEAKVSIAETNGCIESIVDLLETGSCKDQEQAAGILLSLCTQLDHYSHLVLDKGAVPYLMHVSVKGNEKGKATASKLLHLLTDSRCEIEKECPITSNCDASDGCTMNFEEEKPSRIFGSLGKKVKMFFSKN